MCCKGSFVRSIDGLFFCLDFFNFDGGFSLLRDGGIFLFFDGGFFLFFDGGRSILFFDGGGFFFSFDFCFDGGI